MLQTETHQQFFVKENAIPGTIIGSISEAFDRDENDTIYYHLSYNEKFCLHNRNILLKSKLDRESKERWAKKLCILFKYFFVSYNNAIIMFRLCLILQAH